MSTATTAPPAVPEAIEAFTVTLIIRRFNPEVDDEPRWEDFDVEMYPTDRILDALHKIKWEQDGSAERSAAPARTASAVRTPCASTAATAWPARR